MKNRWAEAGRRHDENMRRLAEERSNQLLRRQA
jgi:hypothetical protein